MKKRINWTWVIIAMILIFATYIIFKPSKSIESEIAKCIGEKSTVYSQLGCSACAKQKELFGGSYRYINEIDCFYDNEACIQQEITATPTWIIDGKKYVGVQPIERLQLLTGC